MLQDQVLRLLSAAEGAPISGEQMSRELGVSRAAVWKAISALREAGYQISSAPRRGYQLTGSPDLLSPGLISAGLSSGARIGRELVCLDCVDSTNSEVKRRSDAGAGEGLAVLAGEQTAGRGRKGRSFYSPQGKGLYCSVLLRPAVSFPQLSDLTAWTAVAVCDAIEDACGVRPGIKWTNDIILGGRKVCGILTEVDVEAESGTLRSVTVGIGINVSQTEADFGPELSPAATSLAQELGHSPGRSALAAALLRALDAMYAAWPAQRERYLERYRAACVTCGRDVLLLRPGRRELAYALGIDQQFRLLVRFPNGRTETVESGEVSVRGLCGYL